MFISDQAEVSEESASVFSPADGSSGRSDRAPWCLYLFHDSWLAGRRSLYMCQPLVFFPASVTMVIHLFKRWNSFMMLKPDVPWLGLWSLSRTEAPGSADYPSSVVRLPACFNLKNGSWQPRVHTQQCEDTGEDGGHGAKAVQQQWYPLAAAVFVEVAFTNGDGERVGAAERWIVTIWDHHWQEVDGLIPQQEASSPSQDGSSVIWRRVKKGFLWFFNN